MTSSYVQRCDGCGSEFGHEFLRTCPLCSGLIEVRYDLSRAKLRKSQDPYERFFDLLPLDRPRSVLRVDDGSTPCVHARRLAASMGLENVFLKLESFNPSGTTKDRLATVVLSRFHELGLHEFVTASTGNTARALARGLSLYPHFKMHAFVGEAFAEHLAFDSPSVVTHVLAGGDYSEALDAAVAFSLERDLPFEGGFFNPGRREGLKIAYLEAVDQVPGTIDWYVQGVSSAMGACGTAKAAGELLELGEIDRRPRIVCVQQETCAPIVRGWEAGLEALPDDFVIRDPVGPVKAILHGDPRACYPYVYRMLSETEGLALTVTEGQILAAQRQVLTLEELPCGLAGATTVAALALLADRRLVGSGDTVLLNITD